jgi:hypothetical protein
MMILVPQKCGEFIDQLSDNQLPKKNPAHEARNGNPKQSLQE